MHQKILKMLIKKTRPLDGKEMTNMTQESNKNLNQNKVKGMKSIKINSLTDRKINETSWNDPVRLYTY